MSTDNQNPSLEEKTNSTQPELPETYTVEQMRTVEEHIAKHFGNIENVYHEILSPDIHVDICIIPPTQEKPYYTLVTMGMGAHRMNVPVELAEYQLERAEMVIALPHDWKVGEREEIWYWPMRLLKQLARLPGVSDTWLGWGHTVANQKPYAENTSLCGSILVTPMNSNEVCLLPDGENVNFYQVIPIYQEEMLYKKANNAQALFEQMEYVPYIVETDRCHQQWATGQAQSVQQGGPSMLAQTIMHYLDCPCRYFPPAPDDNAIFEAYQEAAQRGQKEGFIPILVAEDDTLWECLIMNSNKDSEDNGDFGFDAEAVAAYRKQMLASPLPPGNEVLDRLREEQFENDDMDEQEEEWDEEADGEASDHFMGYWNYGTRNTLPLILAEISVKNPWEIFAVLPFGGWNSCPDTPDLMAVSKYWFEQHGAAPAVMTHDVLEFYLPAPVKPRQAMQLAREQYIWCTDIIDQGGEGATLSNLAQNLSCTKHWYFWWD